MPHTATAAAPPIRPLPWGRTLAIITIAFLLAHLADPYAWEQLRDPRVNDRDWGRLLRSMGYLPTWIFGAVALWLASRAAGTGRWRAGALVLAPALAGAIAELVKLVVRRQRPGADSASYLFRPFEVDLWSTRGLGLASSHTAVAVAAAVILARAFPATAWVWYVLAAGCAVTRVLSGAHYVSDTVAAAAIGWLVAELVWRWLSRRADAQTASR